MPSGFVIKWRIARWVRISQLQAEAWSSAVFERIGKK
jgi:hypothetical protein